MLSDQYLRDMKKMDVEGDYIKGTVLNLIKEIEKRNAK